MPLDPLDFIKPKSSRVDVYVRIKKLEFFEESCPSILTKNFFIIFTDVDQTSRQNNKTSFNCSNKLLL